jgi:site-specific recombinase XerC
MNLIRGMNIDPTDKPDMRKMSMPTRSPDGSIKAREVEVAGEYQDMLMKNYEAAVEQGYKGSFYDFLIDQMDEDFDPADSIRVSKLAEQMRGIPSAMDMKMLRKMITG